MKAKAIVVRAHGGAEVIEYTEVDVADPARRSAYPAACRSD